MLHKKLLGIAAVLVLAGASCSKSATETSYTAAEVAAHANAADCWFSIDGSIYNVTEYLQHHPAGAAIVIKYCGTDASTAYHQMGGRGRDHSNEADGDLATYKIGVLTQ